MTLAIFDLDDTLLAGDSASLFCQFLVVKELAPKTLIQQDEAFYQQYSAGNLSMADYIRFMLEPVTSLSTAEIDALMPRFVSEYIVPRLYTEGAVLLQKLSAQGKRIVIVSATAHFIVKAIAAELAVDDVLAISLETQLKQGTSQHYYTGEVAGVPTFREGKVTRLKSWLSQQNESMVAAEFYSDSMNDLALLQWVEHPIATNPDPRLLALALDRGWTVLQWEKPLSKTRSEIEIEQ